MSDNKPEGTALVHKDLLRVVHMRDYIDAIPNELAESFPAMPSCDRYWADSVIGPQPEPEVISGE